MKVIIVCAWWRMLTAESIERKLKTGWDRGDCGRIGRGAGAYWGALSITGCAGRWGLRRRMWRERSLLFCWPSRNRKQRSAHHVITPALKMSLIERRDSILKHSSGECSRLHTARTDRGEHTARWELICEAPCSTTHSHAQVMFNANIFKILSFYICAWQQQYAKGMGKVVLMMV